MFSESDRRWKIINKNLYGVVIDLPLNVLSFSSEALPMYIDNNGNVLIDPDILYINSKQIALPKDGNYTIWYNSVYPSMSSIENTREEIPWLPSNIALIIPSYVAGQLLMNEDLTRATIYKNEFETMLSRLDDNKVLPSYSIKNSSGWTY